MTTQRRQHPPDWPRYMVARRLASGATAYYWTPRRVDLTAGCPMHGEALGPDYAAAVARAGLLNASLDAWRDGRGTTRDPDLSPAYGTLAWLVARYQQSPAWDKVSTRARGDYRAVLDLVTDLRLTSGDRLGDAHVRTISARAVDRIYARLRQGPKGPRTRTAVLAVTRMARAWDVVARLYPDLGLERDEASPWRGVELVHGHATTRPATRDEAYALHRALITIGEPWLAAVPLIAFEWHQRPENILAGHLAWGDWRPEGRAEWVRIVHHKTGERVWLPLSDADGPLFPELAGYLDGLGRPADAIAVTLKGRSGAPQSLDRHRAAALVRRARARAGLPAHVTLAACRHGGLTELGDAELTEQGVMALSGHRTPDAARLYVKRTEAQRAAGARRRRAWIASQGDGGGQAA